MEPRILRLITLLMVVLCATSSPSAYAACADVLRPAELPSEVITPNGAQLAYSYRFQTEETYEITWSKGSVAGGPVGPFPLQPGCNVPRVSEESNEFLLLEKGCGSLCWYFDVLGLSSHGGSLVGSYEQIYRPLAFDPTRNLLAYYSQKDTIAIKNLITGYEQIFVTANICEASSGLCFGDVRFSSDSLLYTWESLNGIAPGELLSQIFDNDLIAQ